MALSMNAGDNALASSLRVPSDTGGNGDAEISIIRKMMIIDCCYPAAPAKQRMTDTPANFPRHEASLTSGALSERLNIAGRCPRRDNAG